MPLTLAEVFGRAGSPATVVRGRAAAVPRRPPAEEPGRCDAADLIRARDMCAARGGPFFKLPSSPR